MSNKFCRSLLLLLLYLATLIIAATSLTSCKSSAAAAHDFNNVVLHNNDTTKTIVNETTTCHYSFVYDTLSRPVHITLTQGRQINTKDIQNTVKDSIIYIPAPATKSSTHNLSYRFFLLVLVFFVILVICFVILQGICRSKRLKRQQ